MTRRGHHVWKGDWHLEDDTSCEVVSMLQPIGTVLVALYHFNRVLQLNRYRYSCTDCKTKKDLAVLTPAESGSETYCVQKPCQCRPREIHPLAPVIQHGCIVAVISSTVVWIT